MYAARIDKESTTVSELINYEKFETGDKRANTYVLIYYKDDLNLTNRTEADDHPHMT